MTDKLYTNAEISAAMRYAGIGGLARVTVSARLDGLPRRTPDARLEAERAAIEAAKDCHDPDCWTADDQCSAKGMGKFRTPNCCELQKALAALARTEKKP